MELIYNNQLSILIDIFPIYLTPKQCVKFYSSNIFLYNIYLMNNKFENYYFTPKTKTKLKNALSYYCINKAQAIIKYGHISYWNTIYITNMSQLFCNKHKFNDDISDWNTSNVINMEHMFGNARNFNQNLNKWNINKVQYIRYIFNDATNFNRLNCNNWDLSNINYSNKQCMYS